MTNLEKMAKVMEEATCYMNKEETPRDQKKTKKNTYQEKTVDENEGGIDDKEEEKKGRKMQKKKTRPWHKFPIKKEHAKRLERPHNQVGNNG